MLKGQNRRECNCSHIIDIVWVVNMPAFLRIVILALLNEAIIIDRCMR